MYTADINGKFITLDGRDDAIRLLEEYGIEQNCIDGIVSAISATVEQEVMFELDYGRVDKDEYESLCDGIKAEVDDLVIESENLRGPSKKNMTRSDIAGRIDSIIENITNLNGALL